MSKFKQELQSPIDPNEQDWSFSIPNLPADKVTNEAKRVKTVAVVSNPSKQAITLSFELVSLNRAISRDSLDKFVAISFNDFHLQLPKSNDTSGATEKAPHKQSREYVVRLLDTGVSINDTRYHFYGHSNSQLKSRSCFLFAGSKDVINQKIEALGDFRGMKTVAKKAKRIGLLFSSVEVALTLDPGRTKDIDDVERNGLTFTDGCGNISLGFARELAKRRDMRFRNKKYCPSVFQIRYKGYKGVLAVDKRMQGDLVAKFRKSMRKFTGGDDNSFAAVDYSKPYSYGYLNDEVVLLLHALGIGEGTLLRKQEEHLDLLDRAQALEVQPCFQFLSYMNRPDLAETALLNGVESVAVQIRRLITKERDAMINKRDEQRCRIFLRSSRLLFGICDAVDCLKERECFVRITTDGDGLARTLINTEVLVTRNPCLHPGDLQKFRAVDRPELAHLVDCIVFSTRGKRPSADLMSGGDLDGDKFLVCWDKDLVPRRLAEAAEYPGPPDKRATGTITDRDRLEYFAGSSNASLGRAKRLYLEWARRTGPLSSECQQLNRLFSQCVDGNAIRIPKGLEEPTALPSQQQPFILDVLHDAAKAHSMARHRAMAISDECPQEMLEEFLSMPDTAISELEAIDLTSKWCRKNDRPFDEFAHFFDYNALSPQDKTWVSSSVDMESALLHNALVQSHLVSPAEQQPFRLNDPRLRWKRVFDSSQDRMSRFLELATRSLELFHKKLIVFKVDARLSLAVYIPRKLETGKEGTVDEFARVFAFPHTGDQGNTYRRAVPTKTNYKVFCDENIFQMYNSQRSDTWVFIRRAAADDSSYRNAQTVQDRRSARQATLEQGINHDFVASVALNKNSGALQRHMGRVNRNGILGAEIYVISNRDIAGLRTLDLWLEFIDTQDVHCNLAQGPAQYEVQRTSDAEWDQAPAIVRQVVKYQNAGSLRSLRPEDFAKLCQWLLEHNEEARLYQICKRLFTVTEGARTDLLAAAIDTLERVPFLTLAVLPPLSTPTASVEHAELLAKLKNRAPSVFRALVLRANDMGDLIVRPLRQLVDLWRGATAQQFADAVELIALAVADPSLAQDLLLGVLEDASTALLLSRPAVNTRFVRSVLGLALEHVSDMSESRAPSPQLLRMHVKPRSGERHPVEIPLRVDTPTGALRKTGDHVRLVPVGAPANDAARRLVAVDAVVVGAEPGRLRLDVLQALPPFAGECSWRMVRCASFVSCKTALDATVRLFSADQQACGLSPLIDGRTSGSTVLDAEMADSSSSDLIHSSREDLNDSQVAAVRAALCHPLTCLWGPPGTGKTHTILSILVAQQRQRPERRILVTAPTNAAVDNIFSRLIAKQRDVVAITNAVRVATDSGKVASDLQAYTCNAFDADSAANNFFKLRKQAEGRVRRSKLVFATCIGAGLGLLRAEMFDTVLIDEASQATEPEAYVPLAKGARTAVLVGDHVQLRPTVGSLALLVGHDQSLFERLYNTGEHRAVARTMLDTQYRMHATLCAFSSIEFYNGKLATGVVAAERAMPHSSFAWPTVNGEVQRMVFVQCSTPEDLGNKSKANAGQTALTRKLYTQLTTDTHSDAKSTIAILTPYTRQRAALAELLPHAIVSSIDGFQGREADVIVLVTARSNAARAIGFLADVRRLNVAVTRARHGLVLVGDRATLTGDAEGEDEVAKGMWRRLLNVMASVEVTTPSE